MEGRLAVNGRRLALLSLLTGAVLALYLVPVPGLGMARASANDCSATLGTSFESQSQTGTLSSPTGIDCYALAGVSAGDRVLVQFSVPTYANATPLWKLSNANESTRCEAGAGYGAISCEIRGTGPWTLSVRDGRGEEAFSYTVNTRLLTAPQGCSDLGAPAAWSFGAARRQDSIEESLGSRCYTFTRGSGEEDGAYWFRAVRTGGTLSPEWTVYGPSGSAECSGSNSEPTQACRLEASGQFAVVVDQSSYGSATGSFYLASKKLTAPAGCTELASVGFAAPPTEGTIAGSGEVDCMKIPGVSAGERVLVGYAASGASANPRWSIVNGSGTSVCNGSYGNGYRSDCALEGPGPWYALTYDQSGLSSFGYSLGVRRLTDPEGCSSLGDPAVWSFSAPRKNGTIGNGLGTGCYTFDRAEGEEDGTYWFRALRTAGNLQPVWSVFGPSGAEECSTTYVTEPDQSCRLLGSGQYAIVVSDQNGEGTGSFFLDAKRLNEPQGCSAIGSSSFEATPQSDSISTAGEVDCYSVSQSGAGEAVNVRLQGSGSNGASPAWAMVDPEGSIVCMSRNYGSTSSCPVEPSGTLSLLVFDASGAGTFTYQLALHKLTEPEGCTPLGAPAAWSFTAPRAVGTVSTGLGEHCYAFTRSEGEADADYWLRAFHTSGTLQPQWTVYGPSGARECSNYAPAAEESCELRASGRFAVVVSDSAGSGTGGYALTMKRLNEAQGCGTLPSIVLGFASTNGNLSVAGEADCYALPATEGDELTFTLSGVADHYAVVAPDGEIVCRYYEHPCRISGEGPFDLLVYSGSGQAGAYRISAECLNLPCGQVATALTEAAPNRLGQGQSASLLLRGHDLDLMDKVTLTHGGSQIEGVIEAAPSEARSAEVKFDTADAAAGSYTVEAHFIDGTTKVLPNAVTIEAARETGVTVETVGRETFRPGTANHISVVVSNPGNVDALGVPIVLRGLPVGSTIEPAFQQYKPVGPAESPTLVKAPYDQAEETISEGGELTAPFLAARVPAGRSVTMEFALTVPSLVNYKLQVLGGECLASRAPGSAFETAVVGSPSTAAAGGSAADCTGAIASKVIGQVFGPCGSLIGDPLIDAAVSSNGGEKFWSWSHAIGWVADGVLCAGEIAEPETVFAAAALDVLDQESDLSGDLDIANGCLDFPSQSSLAQRGVVSLDPNELEGPAGVGTQRFIQASSPLSYQVLFENVAAATAAAQKVTITDQLDSSVFEPSSVQFTGIEFGSNRYEVPVPTDELDTTIDLRPQEDALVHVTGAVTGSTLKVELEAIDPDTLQPPEDPSVGVLPPNVDAPEGEGRLLFSVAPRSLAGGTPISNKATIRFDQNAPIETNTWTNLVDDQAPQPTITASSTPAGTAAEVGWGGTDDASGIAEWRLEVSREGGAFEPWRVASEAGSTDFVPPAAGSYSFRAVAYDGAGNTGQSSIAGVALTAPGGHQEHGETPVTTTPSGTGSTGGTLNPVPIPVPTPTPVPTPAPTPKPQCKKGFRKTKVHGKAKCVKVKKKTKKGHSRAH